MKTTTTMMMMIVITKGKLKLRCYPHICALISIFWTICTNSCAGELQNRLYLAIKEKTMVNMLCLKIHTHTHVLKSSHCCFSLVQPPILFSSIKQLLYGAMRWNFATHTHAQLVPPNYTEAQFSRHFVTSNWIGGWFLFEVQPICIETENNNNKDWHTIKRKWMLIFQTKNLTGLSQRIQDRRCCWLNAQTNNSRISCVLNEKKNQIIKK